MLSCSVYIFLFRDISIIMYESNDVEIWASEELIEMSLAEQMAVCSTNSVESVHDYLTWNWLLEAYFKGIGHSTPPTSGLACIPQHFELFK